MKIRTLHNWDISIKQAIRLQERLSKTVVQSGEFPAVRFVAGCDVAYDLSNRILYGGAVLWDLRRTSLVEAQVSRMPERFPYVPGLLGFREIPVLLSALSGLQASPDIVLVDGQGIAHPRALGLASHLGLHLAVPTVGCAKKILVGIHGALGERKGDWTWLHFRGRRVGAVIRTRYRVRPMYVSPGNRISIEDALKVVLRCLGRFRLPEPLRQAHLLVVRQKGEHDRSHLDPSSGSSH